MVTHSHAEDRTNAGRPLRITLVVVIVVMVAEIIGGLLSNSLALLGDAGHMLTDALAIGLSLFAITMARRPATSRRTFGYHRTEIMAALANGVVLILVSAYIFYEAYQRFFEEPTINSPIMLTIAAIGLVANLIGMLVLQRSSKGSLNIRAAFWHIIGDTLSSVGVIIAGIIIIFTGWTVVDPILACVIGVVILWGAFRIVKEATDVLLESVPAGIDLQAVEDAMKTIEGVVESHDVHIWTITSGIYALSAHVRVDDLMVSQSNELIVSINEILEKKFNITHATLQLECDACSSEGGTCSLPNGHTNIATAEEARK
jgi:cobalt-zinc-cadmium efflux system protein